MITFIETLVGTLVAKIVGPAKGEMDESGFTTAELIGNAALGVAALAVIWGLIQTQIFPKLITFITRQLGI